MKLRDLLGLSTADNIRRIGEDFSRNLERTRLEMAENEVRILRANLPKRLRSKSLLELARRKGVPLTGIAKEAEHRLQEDFGL